MPIIGVIASSAKGAPAAPVSVSATDVGTGRAYNNGAATVSFTPGAGATATSFTATSSPGGFTATGASSPLTVAGLQSGVSYTFTVTATNASGTSPASSASNSITATTVPQAPTIGTATDGGTGTTVSVAFTAGATGGSAITGFTATSSPGSITGTGGSSPITVSGLTTGTAYTFTVTATNANGTSAASAASNSVTPVQPTAYESIASFSGDGSTSEFTFSGIPQTYKSLQLRIVAGSMSSTGITNMYLLINSVVTSTYASHSYQATSSGTTLRNAEGTTDRIQLYEAAPSQDLTPAVGLLLVDIPEYATTNRNKTVQTFFGTNAGNTGTSKRIGQASGVLKSNNAITQVTVGCSSAFATRTTIALYGIKG